MLLISIDAYIDRHFCRVHAWSAHQIVQLLASNWQFIDRYVIAGNKFSVTARWSRRQLLASRCTVQWAQARRWLVPSALTCNDVPRTVVKCCQQNSSIVEHCCGSKTSCHCCSSNRTCTPWCAVTRTSTHCSQLKSHTTSSLLECTSVRLSVRLSSRISENNISKFD